MASATYINGLPLPSDLLSLIHEGRWKCPDDLSALNRIFPEYGDFLFYTLEYMPRENAGWLRKAETDPMWLGEPDEVKAPGDIDPHLSVLIADTGTGYDQPIALDYRHSRDHPRVLTLEWSDDGINDPDCGLNNRWIEIAPDIQSFAKLIGL